MLLPEVTNTAEESNGNCAAVQGCGHRFAEDEVGQGLTAGSTTSQRFDEHDPTYGR